MESNRNMNKRNDKGITLIALVITIIILLILAGVSIKNLVDEDGLIIKTEESVLETEKSEIRETITLECMTIESDRELKEKTDKERLEKLVSNLKTKNKLEEENTDYLVASRFVTITTKKRNYIYCII